MDEVLWVRMASSACRESMHSASAGKAIYYWRWISYPMCCAQSVPAYCSTSSNIDLHCLSEKKEHVRTCRSMSFDQQTIYPLVPGLLERGRRDLRVCPGGCSATARHSLCLFSTTVFLHNVAHGPQSCIVASNISLTCKVREVNRDILSPVAMGR